MNTYLWRYTLPNTYTIKIVAFGDTLIDARVNAIEYALRQYQGHYRGDIEKHILSYPPDETYDNIKAYIG